MPPGYPRWSYRKSTRTGDSVRASAPRCTGPVSSAAGMSRPQHACVDVFDFLGRPLPGEVPPCDLARGAAEVARELWRVQEMQDPAGERRGVSLVDDPASDAVAQVRRGAGERHDRAAGRHVVHQLLRYTVALHARVDRDVGRTQVRRQPVEPDAHDIHMLADAES